MAGGIPAESTFQNQAAYLTANKSPSFQVQTAPYTPPGPGQITVRVHAIAMNPIDYVIQSQGTSLMMPWVTYPFVSGSDVAGTVVEIGPSTSTSLKHGDKVVGYCLGVDKSVSKASGNAGQNAQGGFQKYVVLQAKMAAKIPDSMSFEAASVIPLGAGTAAAGLFQKEFLGLDLPTNNTFSKTSPSKGTVVIWGGSTSVGSNAIQLAVAAGYTVFTTCSPSNNEYCRALGAAKCFDYRSASAVADIVAAIQNNEPQNLCVGALSMGSNGADSCIDILSRVKCAPGKKFVAMATYPAPERPWKTLPAVQMALTFIGWQVKTFVKTKLNGVRWNFIFASSVGENEVGPGVFRDFLGEALQRGTFQPKPEPVVVGSGLESVQEAIETLRKGVSAKKVVVKLE